MSSTPKNIKVSDVRNLLISDGFEKNIKADTLENGFDYLQFHEQRFNFLLSELNRNFKEGKRVLDIGSLDGYLMVGAKLLGYDVCGTDLPQYVDNIKDLCSFYKFDNRPADLSTISIPFSDDYFDVLVFSETLEHLNFYPLPLFKEFSRVMKPGGVLIITTPNLTRLNNLIKIILGRSINHEIFLPYTPGTHFREYSSFEVQYLLEKTDFKIVNSRNLNFSYPNLGYRVRFTDVLSLFLGRKRDLYFLAKKL